MIPSDDREESAPPLPGAYHDDLVMVRIEEDVVARVPMFIEHDADVMFDARAPAPPTLERIGRVPGVVAVEPVFASGRLSPARELLSELTAAMTLSVRGAEAADLRGITLLRLAPEARADRVARELNDIPGVQYAEQVPIRVVQAAAGADPATNRQWTLRAVRWFELAPFPDASNVPVAVIDSGVDFASNRWDAVVDYRHSAVASEDLLGHGTHVVGILAAAPDRADGITGMCRAAISAWKVFPDKPARDGNFYMDPLQSERALNEALTSGARVVNLSLGGTAASRTEELLINRLVASGAVVVAAGGNYFRRGNPLVYPAAYASAIAVAASDELDRRQQDSCTGEHIAIAAPGSNVLSTVPNSPSSHRRETVASVQTGTSMAAPHVSGALALLVASEPGLDPPELRARLLRSARRVAGAMGRKRRTNELGAGILDVAALLG